MKGSIRIVLMSVFITICLLMVSIENGSSEEYSALKGIKSVKAVFDFELANPQSALIHLQVIQQTFKDKNMWVSGKKPEIVIVFIGPSVKLVSKNRSGFKEEDQKTLDEIAMTITELAKDGVKLEICLIAVKVFGVEPSSILPEIKQVGNGWISLIGYGAKGYSLVPVSP
jgi:intracellular sulfur oxidation DsrE/DsrF family protein